MKKKSINKKKDKQIRYMLPEYWISVDAKNINEAIEKAEKILIKK